MENVRRFGVVAPYERTNKRDERLYLDGEASLYERDGTNGARVGVIVESNRARDEARVEERRTLPRQRPRRDERPAAARCGQSAHGHRSKLTFTSTTQSSPVFSFRFASTRRAGRALPCFGTARLVARRPTVPVNRATVQ